MSALPAQNGHNEACCNIPPVVSSGYAAGGAYETLGGLQTCKSHSHSPAPKALTSCSHNSVNSPSPSPKKRRHGPVECHQGPHRHLRHLWLRGPNGPGRRHFGDQRRQEQVRRLDARLSRGGLLPRGVFPARHAREAAEAGRVVWPERTLPAHGGGGDPGLSRGCPRGEAVHHVVGHHWRTSHTHTHTHMADDLLCLL